MATRKVILQNKVLDEEEVKALNVYIEKGLFTEAAELLIVKEQEQETLRSPNSVYEGMLKQYRNRRVEHFFVITIDGKNAPINIHVVTKGLVNRTMVHPREIFRYAIMDNATSVIVAHNHPSGGLQFSDDDISLTKRIKDSGDVLGIPVLDHLLIVPKLGHYRSAKEEGLL